MFVHDHFRQYGVHETIIRALQRLHYLLGERPQEKETFGFFEGIVLYMFHACRDMFSIPFSISIFPFLFLAPLLGCFGRPTFLWTLGS